MPDRPSDAAASHRRPALDGLRAVAVASVAAYHFGGGSSSALPGGFLGVDIFFVLSGYLITGLLVAEVGRTGTVDLVAFWARRVRRLLPAAALVILAVCAWVWFAAPPQTWPARRADLLWTIGYGANWHFLAVGEDYFAGYSGASPLRHAWSLAIEEQFYLVWPLLVLAAVRLWRRRTRAGGNADRPAPAGLPRGRWAAALALVAAAAGSALLFAAQFRTADPNRAYFGTDGRAQELLVGALGAVLLPAVAARAARRPRLLATAGIVGAVLLAVSFVVLHDGSPVYYRGGAFVVSLATLAVLAAVEAAPASRLARVLSVRPAVALGRISYGVYLWHWPVTVAWPLPSDGPLWRTAAVQCGRVAVTLAAAGASYRWVEQPVLQGRAPWVGRSRRRLAVAAVATLGLLVGTATTATALPRGLAAQLDDSGDRPCPGETRTTLRVCLLGEGATGSAAGRPEVMVVGDSTARALAPAMDAATAGTGRPWVQAAWQRCTPTGLLVVPNGMTAPDAPALACTAQARTLLRDAVQRYRPGLVLVTEFWSHHQSLLVDGRLLRPGTAEHRAALTAAYRDLVGDLSASGARVVLVELPPPGESIGPAVAAGRPAGRATRAPGGAFVDDFNAVLRDVAAQDPGRVATVSVTDLVCPSGRCTALVDGRLVRYDGVHVTASFARSIGPELLARARAAAAGR